MKTALSRCLTQSVTAFELIGRRARPREGFTLIELMVAMVVLAIIMTLLLSVTNIVSRTWKGVSDKMQSFEAARSAFGRISANLGQAVLNTYWDYDDASAPTTYERQSELQFLSLPMQKISSAFPAGRYPNTHGLFFQAPTGRVANKSSNSHLPFLLNAFGYFVEYGDDSGERPGFLPPPSCRAIVIV